MNIFLSTWCLVVAGLVFSFPMIYLRVRDTTVLEDEGLYVICLDFWQPLTKPLVSYRIKRDQELNTNVKELGIVEVEAEESGKEMP